MAQTVYIPNNSRPPRSFLTTLLTKEGKISGRGNYFRRDTARRVPTYSVLILATRYFILTRTPFAGRTFSQFFPPRHSSESWNPAYLDIDTARRVPTYSVLILDTNYSILTKESDLP